MFSGQDFFSGDLTDGVSSQEDVSERQSEEFQAWDESEVEEYEGSSDAWWLAAIVGWYVFIR